jgi:hypothetical protein
MPIYRIGQDPPSARDNSRRRQLGQDRRLVPRYSYCQDALLTLRCPADGRLIRAPNSPPVSTLGLGLVGWIQARAARQTQVADTMRPVSIRDLISTWTKPIGEILLTIAREADRRTEVSRTLAEQGRRTDELSRLREAKSHAGQPGRPLFA